MGMIHRKHLSQNVAFGLFRLLSLSVVGILFAILGFIIAYCILGFVVGLVVLAVSLSSGAALIFFKQKKGLHTKKEEHGVFIYACSHRM